MLTFEEFHMYSEGIREPSWQDCRLFTILFLSLDPTDVEI